MAKLIAAGATPAQALYVTFMFHCSCWWLWCDGSEDDDGDDDGDHDSWL